MKVLLLGATGFTGRTILEQALARGHEVTALVRKPAALTLDHARLIKLQGDALDAVAVAAGVRGQDAVIQALGLGSPPGQKRTIPLKRGERSTFNSDATRVLVACMKAAGVKRLVCMSNVGAGETAAAVPWLVKNVLFPLFLPALPEIIADKDRMEPLVKESGLDWTLARFTGISQGAAKGTRKIDLAGKVGMSMRIPDVAAFLLDQLEDRTYVGKAPSVSN